MSEAEKLSELMRGLDFAPQLANATPAMLFAIGQAVANQAKQAGAHATRLAELEAALKPFAAKAATVHPTILDTIGLQYPVHGATVGDLRRAAALLSGKERS